ncbi:competence protein ComK [Staphylococcus warneri]|uniref:competence protein ComK n=1 Tax=Staphylococcus TaxID=1279 RepID=UPI0006405724|nr:competence protein ComK [Staphylococcus sp. FDAARGOS_39]PNN65013.1 competence protein ComK [Staphylococcus sp. FDAARGOS_39]
MTTQNIYVIRKGDMVIRPNYDNQNQPNGSEIIRFDKTVIQSPFKVQKIIERSCKFYGNNYLSKKAETNRITGISSKPPILLTPLFPTYFFPTHSDRQEENLWINMHYVESIKELKHRKCKIIFANNETITLNVSFHILWHQYTNAIFFYYMVDKQSRMKSNDPDKPIDYEKSSLNIFEALSRYSLFVDK